MSEDERLALAEKPVTWVELFIDLVWAFAITRVAEQLLEDHTALGVVEALVVFVPLYWMWVGTTMHANLHRIDQAPDRIGAFAVALCGLVMALVVPSAFEQSALLFAGGYWVARGVLIALVTGRANRHAFTTFTVGATVTGPLLVIGALIGGEVQLVLWGVAALIDLSVPLVARGRLATVPFVVGHLSERYGTFVIIALGETVVAVGEGAVEASPDGVHLAALAAGFVVICAMWWLYFGYSVRAIRGALTRAAVSIEIIRPVLSYAHVGFVAGIVGVTAGIGHVAREPEAALSIDTAALLLGGMAVFLATFGVTRWRLFHSVAWPRLVAAIGCLALLVVVDALPAFVVAALLAVLLVAVNVVERLLAGPEPAPATTSAELPDR